MTLDGGVLIARVPFSGVRWRGLSVLVVVSGPCYWLFPVTLPLDMSRLSSRRPNLQRLDLFSGVWLSGFQRKAKVGRCLRAVCLGRSWRRYHWLLICHTRARACVRACVHVRGVYMRVCGLYERMCACMCVSTLLYNMVLL